MSTTRDTITARVALVGNPNAGKTTLFNALTGQKQKVGNYTGVTVDRKSGEFFTPHGHRLELIDLPGCYSLTANSPDEEVTRRVLLGQQEDELLPDLVLCVVDATHLERHLYLAQQVIDLGYPVVIVLNKIDQAEEQRLRLDPTQLSEDLGVPVLPISSVTKRGLTALKQAIRFPFPPAPERGWKGSAELEKAITDAATTSTQDGRPSGLAVQQVAEEEAFADEVSKQRFAHIHTAVEQGLQRPDESTLAWTDRLDRFVLHPILGWLIFGGLMLAVFWSLFRFAEAPMDGIEGLVGSLGEMVGSWLPEGDFRDLLVDGVIGGVGSVVVFLPQIVMLFFFIGVLESSGYMARAAFLMDRVMAKAGLSGKSFLPLLSGYACAIPGIMATRTIPSAKERLATILILPWTSCSARLPVYLILIPLLIATPGMQTLAMFGVYALGTLTALVAARLLKPRLGPAEPPQFLLELPPYHAPDWRYIVRQVIDRAMAFLKKAGSVILGLSILLWFLNTYPKSDSDDPAEQQDQSFMGLAGRVIEPVVAPLGWDRGIGTAMLTSFAAREVFVSSLAISYATDEEDDFALRERLSQAKRPDGSAIFTPLTILSLLIFYIYALQCLPTTAVVRRETGSWKWALGQLGGMTLIAYLTALLVYQMGGLLF